MHSVITPASHPAPGKTQDIAQSSGVCRQYQLWVSLCLSFDVLDLSLTCWQLTSLFPAPCYPPRPPFPLPASCLAVGSPIPRESLFPWPSASKGNLGKSSKQHAPASSHFFPFFFFLLKGQSLRWPSQPAASRRGAGHSQDLARGTRPVPACTVAGELRLPSPARPSTPTSTNIS